MQFSPILAFVAAAVLSILAQAVPTDYTYSGDSPTDRLFGDKCDLSEFFDCITIKHPMPTNAERDECARRYCPNWIESTTNFVDNVPTYPDVDSEDKATNEVHSIGRRADLDRRDCLHPNRYRICMLNPLHTIDLCERRYCITRSNAQQHGATTTAAIDGAHLDNTTDNDDKHEDETEYESDGQPPTAPDVDTPTLPSVAAVDTSGGKREDEHEHGVVARDDSCHRTKYFFCIFRTVIPYKSNILACAKKYCPEALENVHDGSEKV